MFRVTNTTYTSAIKGVRFTFRALDSCLETSIFVTRFGYFKVNLERGNIHVFFSGKLVFLGFTSRAQAINGRLSLKNHLNKYFCERFLFSKLQLHNAVGCLTLTAHLDLKSIHSLLQVHGQIIHEPNFAGLRFYCRQSGSVFIIFHTGKIIITRCKSISLLKIQSRRITKLIGV